ncbi:MAG: DUF4445 domain-containing protein [Clostridia bacterium]|nr:DUF4445 domain-containing protein [Clostridia bacterium]
MIDYKCRVQDIGKNLMSFLIEQGHREIDTPCGGRGKCGKCLVKAKGALSEPTEREKELLGELIHRGYRISCLTYIERDFSYELPDPRDPEVVTYFSEDRLKVELTPGKRFMAVDIGTTTVALYCIDGATGKIFDKASFVNKQSIYGADVISRLVYAENGGADDLKQSVNLDIFEEAVMRFGDGEELPDYCVICGNTAIEHFVTGEDATGIAKLPFKPASLFGCEYEMPFAKKTYIAPCVAAYVGGDITCGAAACDMDRVEELTLYIDIGTNGEIVLADKDRALCCSAAAGPAFEGANIECGCIAHTGAIEKVWYDGGLKYKTIDNAPAIGICGSGLIDCAAALLESGELDETGRLEKDKYRLYRDIYISQKDIRSLQTAKAAIAAGIKTLLAEMKKPVTAVKKVIIAGGFGMHIDPDSACTIGLIPSELRGRIEFSGNCAGLGAVNCALSEAERKRTEAFAKKLEYIELSGHKKFNQFYIDEMFFE